LVGLKYSWESFSFFRSGGPYACSWEDRESGQKRFKAIVCANEMLFLDARARAGRAEMADEAVEELPF
jgi:hypothetical protein